MARLSAVEKKIFSQLLDKLDDHLSKAGCNDFDLPNTPENRRFFNAIERYCHKEEGNVDADLRKYTVKDGDTIVNMDFAVLSYLRNKLDL